MPRKRKHAVRDLGEAGDRRLAGAVEASQESARSQATAVAETASLSGSSSARVLASSLRQVTPIAPCATAGSISSVERIAVACDGKAKPLEPGEREQRGVGLPLAELLEPRLDIAAEIDDPEIGTKPLHLRLRAASDEVPTTAPGGSSASDRRLGADEGIANIAARQHRADARGRQGDRSADPSSSARRDRHRHASSASSISLVNRPLPPKSRKGLSLMRSPEVVMTLSRPRRRRGRGPRAGASSTCRACQSASGLPRVPIRSGRADRLSSFDRLKRRQQFRPH